MYTLKAVRTTRSGMEGATVEASAESHRELISQLETSALKYGLEISEYLTSEGPSGDIIKQGVKVGHWKVTKSEMAEV